MDSELIRKAAERVHNQRRDELRSEIPHPLPTLDIGFFELPHEERQKLIREVTVVLEVFYEHARGQTHKRRSPSWC